MKSLNEKILGVYPELSGKIIPFTDYPYILQNDSDGRGTYIKTWTYDKIKPTQQQLDSIT